MVRWSDEFPRFPVFLVISSCLFLAAQPTVASVEMPLLSEIFFELWLFPSLMNPQSQLSDLVFEMLFCADSSENTIPEELSKHLLCVCMGTFICLLRIWWSRLFREDISWKA